MGCYESLSQISKIMTSVPLLHFVVMSHKIRQVKKVPQACFCLTLTPLCVFFSPWILLSHLMFEVGVYSG